MAKNRQRQQVVALQKNNAPSTVIDSSNSGSDLDLDLDLQDSWVIVKKQIVKILIPPLPVANKSPPPNPEPVQQQPAPGEMVASESELPAEAFPKAASIQEQKKNKPLAPKRDAQLPRKYPPAENVPTFSKPFRRNSRTETQKAIIMRPRRFQHGPSIFFDQGVLLNQRLRARNLERKLQKAGGLSSWLESRGLGQFVRIFQRKGLSKFQLVNLTMKKLKDMGANAVGPRRKLMHAIDCFCQPCFY